VPLRVPRVVVRVGPGPAWKSGPPEEQPDWDAHAAFVDDLIERGFFVMGGPWTDRLGSMSIWEGLSAEQVREVVRDDPFVRNGVFVLEDVAGWTVYVDTRIG
jgi:uncharacterized protein YciI